MSKSNQKFDRNNCAINYSLSNDQLSYLCDKYKNFEYLIDAIEVIASGKDPEFSAVLSGIESKVYTLVFNGKKLD